MSTVNWAMSGYHSKKAGKQRGTSRDHEAFCCCFVCLSFFLWGWRTLKFGAEICFERFSDQEFRRHAYGCKLECLATPDPGHDR